MLSDSLDCLIDCPYDFSNVYLSTTYLTDYVKYIYIKCIFNIYTYIQNTYVYTKSIILPIIGKEKSVEKYYTLATFLYKDG